MDCADRIGVQLAEANLRPVHALRDAATGATATLAASEAGRRCRVRIRKAGPRAYAWEVEGGAPGRGIADDPEDAYWTALEALAVGLAPETAAGRGD